MAVVGGRRTDGRQLLTAGSVSVRRRGGGGTDPAGWIRLRTDPHGGVEGSK